MTGAERLSSFERLERIGEYEGSDSIETGQVGVGVGDESAARDY